MFIIVSGNIGVGKSTVSEILAKKLGFTPVFETVDNHPTLEDFYSAKHTYENSKLPLYETQYNYFSFATQIFFLSDRWHKHNQALINKNIIADRSLYEDAIFAKVLKDEGGMREIDYNRIYKPLFNTLAGFLRQPDLNIYLYAPVDVLQERIAKRSRSMECNIPKDYLERLSSEYEAWIDNYDGKTLQIDTTKHDLSNENDSYWFILENKVRQALGLPANAKKELVCVGGNNDYEDGFRHI